MADEQDAFVHPVVLVLHGGNERTEEGTRTIMDIVYLLSHTGGVKYRFPCIVDLGDMFGEIDSGARTRMEASTWGNRRVPLGKALDGTVRCNPELA